MNLAQVATLSLGMAVAEGFVLAVLPGADPFLAASRSPGRAATAGILVTFAMLLCAAATWPVGRFLMYFNLYHLQTLFFLLVLALVSMLFELAFSKLPPAFRALAGIHPKSVAVNSAVMGVVVLATGAGAGFIEALNGALSAGAGFTVVTAIYASVRERVTLTANCPKSMEGLPVALVAAALLALAFAGFGGVKVI